MPDSLTLGIDLGGTNIKLAIVDSNHNIRHRHRVPTQAGRGFDHVFPRLVNAVRHLLQQAGPDTRHITAVGYGNPGPLSHRKGIVYASPNLPGWENTPLRDLLQNEINLPVTLENDANAAAYGEFVAGAGADVDNMVLLTLGTGIGAGIILDGQLLRGAFDAAAEVGHTIIVLDGRACPCGQRGCFEQYASANAVAQRYVEAVQHHARQHHRDNAPPTATPLAQRVLAGDRPTAREIEAALDLPDPLALRVWNETARYLALGCVNLQHTLNPQRIVLAGGLADAADTLLIPVRQEFREITWKITKDHPEITRATRGNDAGVIGAAALAREQFT